MSKSLGNYIGINEPAKEMFGKLMRISDELMWRYFELLSFRPLDEINTFKQNTHEGTNPRDIKFLLAEEIVTRFHSASEAKRQKEAFIKQFKEGAMPEDIAEITMESGPDGLPIANLLKEAKLTPSTSDAMRMIKQGAVKIDGNRVEDPKLTITQGTTAVFQVGKRRFARITVT
jgi:tyrosyl-tRNA synthetase